MSVAGLYCSGLEKSIKKKKLEKIMSYNLANTKVLTPSKTGVAKYLASVSSERTKAHCTLPSTPLRASSKLNANWAAAYAMDKVAEPCQEISKERYGINKPIT